MLAAALATLAWWLVASRVATEPSPVAYRDSAADRIGAPQERPQEKRVNQSSPGRPANVPTPASLHAADNFFAFAETLLDRFGASSFEYAALHARIDAVCRAAWDVLERPVDRWGKTVLTLESATLLEARCTQWWAEHDRLSVPTFEGSPQFQRAMAEVQITAEGSLALPADSSVAHDASLRIQGGASAAEFAESLVLWWDANTSVRQALIKHHRLSEEDLGVSVILGAQLFECELAGVCGPRSFASLELCVELGCSPGLSYQEALRASLPPPIAGGAFAVRDQLARIRFGRGD